jgi:glycosyltransferase involved in cell wall biosynthesis
LTERAAASSAKPVVYLNGKFTAQHLTGTQRVALSLIQELDQLLGKLDAPVRLVLVCPPRGIPPSLEYIEVMHTGADGVALSYWEQFCLPAEVRGSLLVNLAGTAPLLLRKQFCMIHDAAVFDCPRAYTLIFRSWYRLLFTVLSRSATQLFTVSDFSRRRLIKVLGRPAERLEVISNGGDHLDGIAPDEGCLSRYGLEAGNYWLVVGGANPNKNLAAVRAAFAGLARPVGAKLVVVGGLNRSVFGDASAEVFSAGDAVVITGPIDDATLKALYQSAIALIFASLYEGFGLPPLEAMSCGCPVLASNVAAMPEVCGDAALYFDPRHVNAISAAMQQLIDEPLLRKRLVAAGQVQVKGFSWKASAQRLLDHLSR